MRNRPFVLAASLLVALCAAACEQAEAPTDAPVQASPAPVADEAPAAPAAPGTEVAPAEEVAPDPGATPELPEVVEASGDMQVYPPDPSVVVNVDPTTGSTVVEPAAQDPTEELTPFQLLTTFDWLSIGLAETEVVTRLPNPVSSELVEQGGQFERTLVWAEQGIEIVVAADVATGPFAVSSFTLVSPAPLVSLTGLGLDSPRSVVDVMMNSFEVDAERSASAISAEQDGVAFELAFQGDDLIEVQVSAAR